MWIVSNDTVFAEALQIALRGAGMETDILSALPSRPEESDGWIIDLDCIPSSVPLPSPAITYARSPRGHAQVDLTRPFLFSELIGLAKQRFPDPARPASIVSEERKNPAVPFLRLIPEGVMVGGKSVSLSPSEHALLSLLMEHPGECVPTERIDALWQEKGGNTTAVYIRYLRKKLDEPTGLRLIRSIRGKGYCLCLPS